MFTSGAAHGSSLASTAPLARSSAVISKQLRFHTVSAQQTLCLPHKTYHIAIFFSTSKWNCRWMMMQVANTLIVKPAFATQNQFSQHKTETNTQKHTNHTHKHNDNHCVSKIVCVRLRQESGRGDSWIALITIHVVG